MPIFISQDFIANSTTTNEQYSPTIAALADGRFVMSWFSADNGSNYDIRARVFNADGSAVGNDFVASTSNANNQFNPTIAALADGRFVMSWYSRDNGSNYDIRARIFNADGSATGSDFVAGTTNANSQESPTISVLADGQFVMSWQSNDNGSNYDIRARIFNADGSAVGPDFVASTSNAYDQFSPTIAALADGRFVMSWQSSDNGSNYDIRARLFYADGTAAAPDFVASTSNASSQSLPSIAALADGRFVMSWYSFDNGSNNDIRARIFNADGTAAGPDFVAGTTNANSQLNSTIAALADGRFVMSWQSNDNGSNTDIRARIFNADGTAAGNDFVVSTSNANSQLLPTIAALADGRFVMSWQSNDNGSNTDIRSAILDPNRFNGTSSADSWIGGNGHDTLFGFAGDDVFSGKGDNDFLNGGDGGDTLRGDAGNDRLEGGFSNDFLFGGKDNDTLWGGGGIDTLNGGKGSDRFLYMNKSEAGDIITKFEKIDHFVFEGQAFKLGTYAGQLREKNFYSTTTNKAHDANDRFIFRTGDDTLWFDADGKGGVASVKIADLSNNFNLHASDILIV